jgi:membrane associated rhomboid family serine protease
MVANGGKFQPFSCPATCPDGRPCFEDGSPCQANPLLGPSVDTMDRLGAKNDVRIFEYNEWWRIATCNWLHAGLLHLAFNMLGVWRIGVELEKTFGTVRVALLYIFAGLFGTVLSIIFLPGLLSVGASACVFGLVGACWADVIVNFCARCTLRNSGIACLTVATLFNVSIGFTPWYPAVELETRPCPLPSHPSH